MKKVLSILSLLLLVTGCTNINSASYDEIIDETLKSDVDVQNTYRKGYKFYLPHGMSIIDSKEYNEKIKKDNKYYYFYIDLIGYLNEEPTSKDSENAYFYKRLEEGSKTGYIEIKKYENEEYLVEIVYNYAKIEVIVDKDDITGAVTDSLVVLSSIKYNDSFLKNLSEESLLNYKEEQVDLFDKNGKKESSNFLEYREELDDYSGENALPDYDKIN